MLGTLLQRPAIHQEDRRSCQACADGSSGRRSAVGVAGPGDVPTGVGCGSGQEPFPRRLLPWSPVPHVGGCPEYGDLPWLLCLGSWARGAADPGHEAVQACWVVARL